MSLHGNVMVNGRTIGEWVAQNAGPRIDSGIYRCWVIYTNLSGYTTERRFFLHHNYGDGALVLGAHVMLEFTQREGQPVYSEQTEWFAFCERNDLDPYESLGRHIKLREKP